VVEEALVAEVDFGEEHEAVEEETEEVLGNEVLVEVEDVEAPEEVEEAQEEVPKS
jgi:hypothetical protein